jgi:hypothetical protein
MKLITILFTILFSTSVFAAATPAAKVDDKNKKPAVEHTTEKAATDKVEGATEDKTEEKK